MTLGENIVRLRTGRGLSQEALADRLGVSRQSVSKWETDVSTPELEKLLMLGEVFGITLDELVKGEGGASKAPASETAASAAPKKRTGSELAGVLFLFLGFVLLFVLTLYGGLAAGLIFGLPFLTCGLLCLLGRWKRRGLWCGWGLYILTDLYLRFATGLSWRTAFHAFRWTAQMNYLRLVIACLQFLIAAVLVVLTAWSFSKKPWPEQGKLRLAAAWASASAVELVQRGLCWLLLRPYRELTGPTPIEEGVEMGLFWTHALGDWLLFAALTVALTWSIQAWRGRAAAAAH